LACEIAADVIYVSPTQINFVVPDISIATYSAVAYQDQSPLQARVVLIRDGQRFDGGAGGSFPIGNAALTVIFIGGYDCRFSLSLTASTCYPSGNTAIGAVTDLSGNLITSKNPVHGGQIVTLWMTDLGGLSQSATTGLLQQASPRAVAFGLSQYGVSDMLNWAGTTPIWAGESPQFVGLDQINIVFPGCAVAGKTASSETRYDAYMAFSSPGNVTGSVIKIYIPYLAGPGDFACRQ
jgi:hypothetical protein